MIIEAWFAATGATCLCYIAVSLAVWGSGFRTDGVNTYCLIFMPGRSRKGIQQRSELERIQRAERDVERRFFSVGNRARNSIKNRMMKCFTSSFHMCSSSFIITSSHYSDERGIQFWQSSIHFPPGTLGLLNIPQTTALHQTHLDPCFFSDIVGICVELTGGLSRHSLCLPP